MDLYAAVVVSGYPLVTGIKSIDFGSRQCADFPSPLLQTFSLQRNNLLELFAVFSAEGGWYKLNRRVFCTSDWHLVACCVVKDWQTRISHQMVKCEEERCQAADDELPDINITDYTTVLE